MTPRNLANRLLANTGAPAQAATQVAAPTMRHGGEAEMLIVAHAR